MRLPETAVDFAASFCIIGQCVCEIKSPPGGVRARVRGKCRLTAAALGTEFLQREGGKREGI